MSTIDTTCRRVAIQHQIGAHADRCRDLDAGEIQALLEGMDITIPVQEIHTGDLTMAAGYLLAELERRAEEDSP